MKTLKQIQEKWEHYFSGSEMFDNSNPDPDDNDHSLVRGAEIDHIDQLHSRLARHYTFEGDTHQGDVHRAMIDEYTSESGPLNEHLLERDRKNKIGAGKEFADFHAGMSNLTRLHRTPGDMHVYSGVGFSPAKIGKQPNAGLIKVRLPAFTSTSLSPGVARSFGAPETTKDGISRFNLIKIHIPEGSHGAYIAHHSNVPSENEFVLPTNSKLHIHPHPTISPSSRGFGPRLLQVWHARLVHDGVEPTRHMK